MLARTIFTEYPLRWQGVAEVPCGDWNGMQGFRVQRPHAHAGRRLRDQTSAANARSRIVSTEPIPAILRYFGARASPVAAQFE